MLAVKLIDNLTIFTCVSPSVIVQDRRLIKFAKTTEVDLWKLVNCRETKYISFFL